MDLLEDLAREFPRRREDLAMEVAISAAEPVRVMALLGYFTWGILKSAIRSADDDALDRCYAFVEGLLSTSDRDLRDATHLQLYPALLSDDMWARETQRRAGPLLTAEIDEYTGGTAWRTQISGFGAPPDPSPREAIAEVYFYKGELLLHAFQRSTSGALVITPPFSRLPVGSDASSVGAAVLAVLSEVVESAQSPADDRSDEFSRFAGDGECESFYTEATTVQIVSSVLRDEITVWPTRALQVNGLIESAPRDPSRIVGWNDPEGLGRAVLSAGGI